MDITWDDVKEILVGIGLMIILVAIAAGLLLGIIWALDSHSCPAKTEQIGFEHRWSIMGGCQIEVNPGQWIPLEQYFYEQP